MKKKIIFMIINMNVGGTEKALLNMISHLPKEKYEITILMLEKYGGFLNDIPCHVQVKYLQGYSEMKEVLNEPPLQNIKKLLKKGKIIKSTNILLLHSISKLFENRNIFYKYILHNQASLEIEYDYAIAYAGPMDFISFFVINKINAKKKVQWIHFDITKIGFNTKFALKLYKKFDKIFVVSNEGKEKLDKVLPQYKNKTETFKNIIPSRQIIKMAEENKGFEDNFQGFRILTVGRLSKEKGQDLTIEVCARLKREGYPIRWYCIGEGVAREEYEKLLKLKGLQNDYILLGSHSNPYPYMKQCDIYVQSSRHEGYCITLAEAKCFASPIVSTRVTGVDEHLTHEETGLITDFNEEKMCYSLKQLIDDEILYSTIKRNLKSSILALDSNIIGMEHTEFL